MESLQHDLIERFLRKEMNPEELAAFDEKITGDDDLAAALALELAIRKAGAEDKRKRTGRQLAEISPVKKSIRPFFRPYFLAIAAAFTLLIALGFLLYKPSAQSLISKSEAQSNLNHILTRDAAVFQTMGEQEDLEKKYLRYQEISKTANPCDYIDLSYYAGVYSLFVKKDYAGAVSQLKCAEQEGAFREGIGRLLVMAYGGAGDWKMARRLVEEREILVESLPKGIQAKLANDHP